MTMASRRQKSGEASRRRASGEMVKDGIVHACDLRPAVVGTDSGDMGREKNVRPFPRGHDQRIAHFERFHGEGVERCAREMTGCYGPRQGRFIDDPAAPGRDEASSGFHSLEGRPAQRSPCRIGVWQQAHQSVGTGQESILRAILDPQGLFGRIGKP